MTLLIASLFLSLTVIGQDSGLAQKDLTVKKSCIPTEECAKAMGMTLEECKKLVKQGCSKGKVATVSESSTEGSSLHANLAEGQGDKISVKAQCNVEECAKLLGISVEECLERCRKCCSGKKKQL